MAENTTEIDELQAALDNDQVVQAAFQQIEQMRRAGVPLVGPAGSQSIMGWAQRNLKPLLEQRGIEMPHDWSISLGEDAPVGQLTQRGYWDRNADWLVPAIVGGASIGANYMSSRGGEGGSGGGGNGGSGNSGGGTGTGTGTGTLPSTPQTFDGTGFAPTVSPSSPGTGIGTQSWGSRLTDIATNPKTYTTIANQLGRMGEGQAGERADENAFAQDADTLRNSQFNTAQTASTRATEAEEDAKRYRAQLGITAPTARMQQAILGSLVNNVQPFTVGDTGRIKVPTISGGLTPAALSPEARNAGLSLQSQAIDALLSGSDIPEDTDFQSARLPAPGVTPYQQPGTGESILSGIGVGGSILSGILDSLSKQSKDQNTIGQPAKSRG